MDYLNPIFGQNENKQLEIAIVTIRISKQRYQISTESTMKKGIQSELIYRAAWFQICQLTLVRDKKMKFPLNSIRMVTHSIMDDSSSTICEFLLVKTHNQSHFELVL